MNTQNTKADEGEDPTTNQSENATPNNVESTENTKTYKSAKDTATNCL